MKVQKTEGMANKNWNTSSEIVELLETPFGYPNCPKLIFIITEFG